MKLIVLLLLMITPADLLAQSAEPIPDHSSQRKKRPVTILTYVRVIQDTKGRHRIDENLVSNFTLNNWLKLELGIRQGERPQNFNSYFHYKVELQTKSFWQTMRFIARLSDNVIRRPTPSYQKTNELFIVELKRNISNSLMALAGGGYVVSHQDQAAEALPNFRKGTTNSFPAFKLALRYIVQNNMFIEGSYGSYDVFNPYRPDSPFVQASTEIKLTGKLSINSYYRYQFDHQLSTPVNNFLSVGLKLEL